MEESAKLHWEHVYKTKHPQEVSWTQVVPATSLDLIQKANIPKNAAIIDVGGGDSNLVDFLLAEGYSNITVLDISANAIDRAKLRLGDKADHVFWVTSNITEYKPDRVFDFWHDRAAFHFLTDQDDIEKYKHILTRHARKFLAIATFSEHGPKKCSGLEVKQYSADSLVNLFNDEFTKVSCFTEDHQTPFNTIQNFTFCFFSRTTAFHEPF